jgi:hypothetical protein
VDNIFSSWQYWRNGFGLAYLEEEGRRREEGGKRGRGMEGYFKLREEGKEGRRRGEERGMEEDLKAGRERKGGKGGRREEGGRGST